MSHGNRGKRAMPPAEQRYIEYISEISGCSPKEVNDIFRGRGHNPYANRAVIGAINESQVPLVEPRAA